MSLRDLGFTPLQERIYLLLVAAPTTPLAGLVEATGVSQAEAADGIDALVELGVLRLGPDGVVVPRPAFALGRLIERIEDELMARYRRASDVRSEIALLDARYGTGAAEQPDAVTIERIEDLGKVRERIEELAFFARESLDSIQPGGPQSREAIEASRPLDRRSLRRGIAMRLINDRAVLSEELNRVHVHELVAMGIPVRLTDRTVERLLIFDRRVAVVPIEPNGSRRGALVVRQPSLVGGLIDLFERVWAESEPIETGDPAPPTLRDEPSDTDRRVLALLATGATDATIARELGVSVRHLGRRISRLHAMLGADSRFRAGAEAERRGWL